MNQQSWKCALVGGVAAVLLAGCAHSPRILEESTSTLALRQDYLTANPDGKYNHFIERGEVTRGMNYVEVLASWGAPEARSRKVVKDVEIEEWAYVARDETSGDWVEFSFKFEKQALVDWYVGRHYTKNAALNWADMPGSGAINDDPRSMDTPVVRR